MVLATVHVAQEWTGGTRGHAGQSMLAGYGGGVHIEGGWSFCYAAGGPCRVELLHKIIHLPSWCQGPVTALVTVMVP